MVDKGWSESPPIVRDLPPPPPLPKNNDLPPPPPLPGSEPPPAPASSKDDITRDETPEISDVDDTDPPTEAAPRELPLYEEATTTEFLVTRVDDQMMARANAMTAEGDELPGEKTVVAATIPEPPETPPPPAPKPPVVVEPFAVARSSPSAAAEPPPPPPLPKSSPSAEKAPPPPPLPKSSPSTASKPAASAPSAPPSAPPLPRPLVVMPSTKPTSTKPEAPLAPKVRTQAWPIQVNVPIAPVAPAPAAQSPKPVAPSTTPVAPVAPKAPPLPAASSSPSSSSAPTFPQPPTFPQTEIPTRSDPTVQLDLEASKRPADTSVPPSITMVDRYGPVSTLRDALLGRVRVANRPVPLWIVLAPVLVLTAMLAALFVGVLGGSSSPSPEASPAASGSGESGGSSPVSAPAAGEKSGNLSSLERAASGDAAALSALEQKKPKDLSTDEAIALARGRVARDVAAAKKLRERLAADPGLAKDKKVIADLLRFAHGRETSHDSLATMAALPGPLSADLVYEVWTGTAERSDATELARSILLGKDVRPKASPALSVALDLREATTCEESKALLSKAIDQGDKRALVPINRLARKTGCGPNKKQDCYPCLRDGDLIKRAFNAVRVRREPEILN
jgi:hypothetical protein